MINVGDIMSTMEGVQYHGGYLEYCMDVQHRVGYYDACGGDILSTVGGYLEYVCMYVEMFIQGYPRHNSGNYGVPVVKKLV